MWSLCGSLLLYCSLLSISVLCYFVLFVNYECMQLPTCKHAFIAPRWGIGCACICTHSCTVCMVCAHCIKVCVFSYLTLFYIHFVDLQSSVVGPLLDMHLPAFNQLLEDVLDLGNGR